jgi:hypothetical protein
MLIRHHTTLPRCDCIGTLRSLYKGMQKTNDPHSYGSGRTITLPSCQDLSKGVTEPPKIIPYYRLSLSTCPLSNNKELLSRFRRVKPGESLTTGSRYALSPHKGGARVQHYITLKSTSSTLLQTSFFIHESKHGSEFKQRKVNYTHDTHRRPSMHITHQHRSPIQPPIPLE